ncbi:MAG: type II toxin-antitoxin system HicB family antitoxin [Burkholderiales bacterium]|nr:type II toxin-antitoxin system HicB family antitoxin [Burkholderiales bacterium]
MALPSTSPGQGGETLSGGGSARIAAIPGNQTVSTMNHKGYVARIEFDERDDIFVGRVLGLRTLISFHGETVQELRQAFVTAIEEFLRDCEEQGIRPERPASGKLMLRIPPDVHGAALVAAQAAGKSLNQWAAKVIEEAARR